MQNKADLTLALKWFVLPKKNHWMRRTVLVFSFTLFDYFSTLVFCRAPHEEANILARVFMESLGVPAGLTAFVMLINLPIYMILSLDSHAIRLPARAAVVVGVFVDLIFAWFIAGPHFSGGASWFWFTSDSARQVCGAAMYLCLAFLVVRPRHRL